MCSLNHEKFTLQSTQSEEQINMSKHFAYIDFAWKAFEFFAFFSSLRFTFVSTIGFSWRCTLNSSLRSMSKLQSFEKVEPTNGHAKFPHQAKSPTYCPRPTTTVVKNSPSNHHQHSTLIDKDDDFHTSSTLTPNRRGMKKFFKKLGQAVPAAITWLLIVGCSSAFFYLLVPAIIQQHGLLGIILCSVDAIWFLFLVSNLYMASSLDPGTHPLG